MWARVHSALGEWKKWVCHHLSEWKAVLADVPLGPAGDLAEVFTLHMTLPPCESRKINSRSMSDGEALHDLV